MNTASRKAKGRRLQNLVRDAILDCFEELTPYDVTPAVMGEAGSDIKLSAAAKQILPVSFECKNQEGLKKIYDWYEQAWQHTQKPTLTFDIPLLVIKSNKKEPLVILDFYEFMEILRSATRYNQQWPSNHGE